MGDPAAELAFSETAVAAARESGLSEYVGEALLALGRVHIAHKQKKPAIAVLQEAADLLSAAGDQRAFDALRLLQQPGAELASTPQRAAPTPRAPKATPQLTMDSVVVSDDSTFLDLFNEIRIKEGGALLSATLGSLTYAVWVHGESGRYHFDLSGLASRRLIDTFATLPGFLPGLLGIAAAVSKHGSRARAQGQLGEAVSAYNFCLDVATLHNDANGLNILSRNLFTLERVLTFTGAGAPIHEGPPPHDCDALLGRIHQIAATHLATLDQFIDAWSVDADDVRRLDALATYHRFQLISGPDAELQVHSERPISASRPASVVLLRRARFNELRILAEARGDYHTLLESIYNEFACAGRSELVHHIVGVNVDDEHENNSACLALVMNTWFKTMPHLWDNASEVLQMVCDLAAERLNRIRISIVMEGRTLGHKLSYQLTYLTTAIGRNQVIIALALDHAEQALAYWEASRSRALTDWMGRTHFVSEIVIRRDFEGVSGEVTPADLSQIKAAAAEVQAPILAFFAHERGLHTWLVDRDGTIRSEPAGRIDELVDKLMAELPYADQKDVLRGPLDDFFLDTHDSSKIDDSLDEIRRRVVPQPLLDALMASGAKRVVIMPDAELDLLPFCCLRANGRYLVEDFEIYYWPCVAAWRLCYQTMRERENVSPVVFGNPDFSVLKGQGFDFSPLPQSEQEAGFVASRLKVKAVIGATASAKTLRAIYQSAAPDRPSIPVLHLATHGVLDMARPGDSFLAFADGALTVDDIMTDARAYRTGLTVLSACQTGLGHRHPDSMIGLTSAFFIAGACAVLSSLWKVPDSSTRILMEQFYDILLASPKARPAEALAKAQRQALADPARAHPFRWAAFRMAGADLHPFPTLAADPKLIDRMPGPGA